MNETALTVKSPLGRLTLVARDGVLAALDWGGQGADHTPLLDRAAAQLAAYFDGALQSFDLPFADGPGVLLGQVQAAMLAIPYGETRTYGDLARELGAPAQAIGQACGANPLPIFIPCHRILAANGLGGYSGRGGIESKVALLLLEGAAGLLI